MSLIKDSYLLTQLQHEIVVGLNFHTNLFVAVASKDCAKLLKKAILWYIDTTFNINSFYISSILVSNSNFVELMYTCYMYVY